jgi:hypothetical protein
MIPHRRALAAGSQETPPGTTFIQTDSGLGGVWCAKVMTAPSTLGALAADTIKITLQIRMREPRLLTDDCDATVSCSAGSGSSQSDGEGKDGEALFG